MWLCILLKAFDQKLSSNFFPDDIFIYVCFLHFLRSCILEPFEDYCLLIIIVHVEFNLMFLSFFVC